MKHRALAAVRTSAFLAPLALFAFVGCSGVGKNDQPSPSPAPTPQPQQAVSVTVTPATATVAANGQQQFVAAVANSKNVAVTWSVDGVANGNASTGTMDNAGLYTAPASSGNHTVTATSAADTSKTASASVTVTRVVAVAISPPSATVAADATQQFTSVVTGTSNFGVVWSVDGVNGGDTSGGTISNNGLYEAPANSGPHTVMATSVVDSSATANAQVTVPPGISISPAKARVAPSGTQQFTVTATDPSVANVTWSVDGTGGGSASSGTISASGLYAAPGTPGTHTISATAVSNPSVNASASVTIPVVSMTAASVLTYHNDLMRSGANLNETILTPQNVNASQFGKLFSYPVDGQVYAQPLFVGGLSINGGSRNVVYVATEHDSVYAFDADGLSTGALWHVSFINPSAGITTDASADTEGISPELGITSTPVIDGDSGTLYVVSVRDENGSREFQLHALDLVTGSEKFGGPVQITATVSGTGAESSGGKVSLTTACYQRAGLTLANGVVYVAFGHCVHGWVTAYDAHTLARNAVYNTTPNGAGGTIWMGGGAPASDASGDIFLMTGVDLNDPPSGFNDSFLRFSPTLGVKDFFAPGNEAFLRANDADLGSGAPMLLPDNASAHPHELVGGGKDGRIFLLDRDRLGQFNLSQDQVVQEVHIGTTQFDVLFDTPAFWNNLIYYHGEQDVMQVLQYNNGALSTSLVAHSSTRFGPHGATPSVSANGDMSAIVWEVQADQWRTAGPAVLHAYDATSVAHELYNSGQNAARDTAGAAVKFVPPTVVNGKVFVATGTELDVYGLLQP